MVSAVSLPADSGIGAVRLRVADLRRALAFYQGLLDLHVLDESGERAVLGAAPDGPPIVHLLARPGIRQRGEHTLGLYHIALLYPDRRDLGRTLLRLFEQRVPFQGFADHGVSEAAYLSDPDGNGLELAADRPRQQWKRDGGDVIMFTQVLNVTNLLRAVDGDPWIGPPAGLRVGHVHLHVSDLVAATRFYSDVLGFEVTNSRFHQAVFLAAGGYHHHIALNTWARGKRPPDNAVAGLAEFTVQVPDPAARQALTARLAASGASVEEDGGGFVTRDPEGNAIRVE